MTDDRRADGEDPLADGAGSMRAPARALCALSLMALVSCALGMGPERLTRELTPGGAQVRVRVHSRSRATPPLACGLPTLVGELIGVEEESLLLLAPAGDSATAACGAMLIEIAVESIDRIATVHPPVDGLAGRPTRPLLVKLRPVSRHPQGVAPALLQELLESLGQQRLVRVAR